MSQYTSLIPPDVLPPEPPGTKVISIIFSTAMSLLLIGFIIFISVDFIADMTNTPSPYDAAQEQAIQDECGPFISDFLGLNFPGQYAPKFGKKSRFESYPLTEEEQRFAILKLQDALKEAENVSVEIIGGGSGQLSTYEKFFLSYDSKIAEELCAKVDSAKNTSISPLDYMQVSDLVFTFSPSEVKINVKNNSSVLSLYITLGKGWQRWEGYFGSGFASALLNTRLLTGETIRSCIAERIPRFPIDSESSEPDGPNL